MVGRGVRNSLLWIGVFVLNLRWAVVGEGGQQPHTHTHTHTHSLTRARARPALPAHGRLVRVTAPPSLLEHQLALLAQSLVATAVVSAAAAAAGTVGAGARGPRLRWALVLLSLPLPQPRID